MERLQIWAIGIVLLGYWIGALGFGVDSTSYGLCAASVGAENYLRCPLRPGQKFVVRVTKRH